MSPTRRSARGRKSQPEVLDGSKAHPEVREESGSPPGGPGVVLKAHPEVWGRSGGPSRGPGVVRRATRRFGGVWRPSRWAGRCLEALL